MKLAWAMTMGGVLLSASIAHAQYALPANGSGRAPQPPAARPTLYRTSNTPAPQAAPQNVRLAAAQKSPTHGNTNHPIRTAQVPGYSAPGSVAVDGGFTGHSAPPAVAPAGPAPGWATNTGIPSYPQGAVGGYGGSYGGGVDGGTYEGGAGGMSGDGSCGSGCSSGCGHDYCCNCKCRLFLWRSTGDMPQHVPYYPNAHGYYYFRPYNAIHILQQQEMVARLGLDTRNPYDNGFFERIYAEQGYKGYTPEGSGASLPGYDPTVTVALPGPEFSR